MLSQWVALIMHSVYRSILTFAEDDGDDLFICLASGYLPVAPGKSKNNNDWKGRSNHSHDVTDKPTQTVFLEILTL